MIVQNAGLCLIHPFFKPLLTQFGFYQLEPNTQSNILFHTLNFLAGNEAKDSNEFYRIICSIDSLPDPSQTFNLDENIRNECTRLLHDVINHWQALSGVSITDFQTIFLQRQGNFIQSETECKLIMEKSPVDILLERIPCNINILPIKQSNQTKILYVEW